MRDIVDDGQSQKEPGLGLRLRERSFYTLRCRRFSTTDFGAIGSGRNVLVEYVGSL